MGQRYTFCANRFNDARSVSHFTFGVHRFKVAFQQIGCNLTHFALVGWPILHPYAVQYTVRPIQTPNKSGPLLYYLQWNLVFRRLWSLFFISSTVCCLNARVYCFNQIHCGIEKPPLCEQYDNLFTKGVFFTFLRPSFLLNCGVRW